MRIISHKAIVEFGKKHSDAIASLDTWYRIAKRATWQSIAEVKIDFPHADAVGHCTVFNIGGNKYRLITHIDYLAQIIFIRCILTHAEYNRGGWKNDC